MAMQKQLEDWHNFKSVLERNEVMLSQQLATDVTFSLPVTIDGDERKTIGAHKYMLIASSQVFWAMFCGGFKEESTGKIDIEDIEFDTFEEVLRFIYTERLNLTAENVIHVYHAAHKYMIALLKQKCMEVLKTNLDKDNVCEILQHCLFFNEAKLKSKCFKIIQVQTRLVLKSDGFKQISRETLMQILDAKEVNVPEYKIFEACLAWAKHKSGDNVEADVLREHLGEALYKICIPTMSTEELGRYITPTGILTDREELLCYRFASKSQWPSEIPFPKEPRKIVRKIAAWRVLNSGTQLTANVNNLECIGILSSNSLFVMEIVELMLICEKDLRVEVDIVEQLDGDARSVSTANHDQINDCRDFEGHNYARIMLDESIFLSPKGFVEYKISYSRIQSSYQPLKAEKKLKFIGGSICRFQHSNYTSNWKLVAQGKQNGACTDTFIPLIGIVCALVQ